MGRGSFQTWERWPRAHDPSWNAKSDSSGLEFETAGGTIKAQRGVQYEVSNRCVGRRGTPDCWLLGNLWHRKQTSSPDFCRPFSGSCPFNMPHLTFQFLSPSPLLGSSCQYCDVCAAGPHCRNPATESAKGAIVHGSAEMGDSAANRKHLGLEVAGIGNQE